MLLTGARHALAPVLDIGRDPRWGRIEETYGEDPYLAAELSCAYIAALQGDDLRDGVAATGKHLVGHGLAEGGMNQAPAHVGTRELHDEQLFPFEAAVRTTGLASMMPAYCDVDGLPCHASHELLTTILRERWGFDGIVSSDYIAVEMLATAHRLTDDLGEAARLSLLAGVDSELPRTAAFGRPLAEAIAAGRVDEAVIDAAVARMLRLKFRLGLFERLVRGRADRRGARGAGRRGVARRPRAGPSLARPGRQRRHPAAGPGDGAGWRSSARSPIAPGTCSATTATSSTSRRSRSSACRATPWASITPRRRS